MVLQCCKIKWNEENLGLCFQVKLNCSKVDKIICKAFLSCTIELLQLFCHLEALTTILKLKGPFFSLILFYFILTSHHTTHCLVDWKAVEIFIFGICILCWVCPWIRPETVELGSWVLTCFSYNKLTKYHYFLFSFKQFDLRTKFCLGFLMCVCLYDKLALLIIFFGFGILAIDGYATIYWISFVVFLLVKIRLLMYSVVSMKLLLYLFFPVFNVLLFLSMSTQLSYLTIWN